MGFAGNGARGRGPDPGDPGEVEEVASGAPPAPPETSTDDENLPEEPGSGAPIAEVSRLHI